MGCLLLTFLSTVTLHRKVMHTHCSSSVWNQPGAVEGPTTSRGNKPGPDPISLLEFTDVFQLNRCTRSDTGIPNSTECSVEISTLLLSINLARPVHPQWVVCGRSQNWPPLSRPALHSPSFSQAKNHLPLAQCPLIST